MITQDEKYRVMRAMCAFGGSFAYQLGMLIGAADAANVEKIKQTWPDEWRHYLELYEQAAANGRLQ